MAILAKAISAIPFCATLVANVLSSCCGCERTGLAAGDATAVELVFEYAFELVLEFVVVSAGVQPKQIAVYTKMTSNNFRISVPPNDRYEEFLGPACDGNGANRFQKAG
jgi:hypothetical protein